MSQRRPNVHPNEREIFFTLDAMRGLAAISVMIYHYSDFFSRKNYLPSSYLAVDFFFLLSGFVIAHAYEKRLQTNMTFFQFARVRLIRLYPTYVIGLILGSIFYIAKVISEHNTNLSPLDLINTFLLGALFIPNTVVHNLPEIFPLNPASWSLFAEILLNIIYASVFKYLNNIRLVLTAFMAAIGIIVFTIFRGSLDVGMIKSTLFGGLFRCTFGFCLGIYIYRHRNMDWKFISPILSLLILGSIFTVGVNGILRIVYDLLCCFFIFPILLIKSSNLKSRYVAIFEFLALISYPIYILHGPLLYLMYGGFKAALHYDPKTIRPISGLLMGTFAIFASFIIAEKIDAPLRRWLSHAIPPAKAKS